MDIRGLTSKNKKSLTSALALQLQNQRMFLASLSFQELQSICEGEQINNKANSKSRLIAILIEHLVNKQEGRVLYNTKLGTYHCGDSTVLLAERWGTDLFSKVDLILTSPPFPLNQKKKYGNLLGDHYKEWFESLAPIFSSLLSPTGSIVIELGNAWVPGRPVQSLLHLESLMAFVKAKGSNFRLCQSFVCYNPARLPSPAQWVTIDRIRVTDSYTHVWWISKSDHPKADNKRVLRPYSNSMHKLIKRGTYNAGNRPSEHRISKHSFLHSHEGSIMPNVIELKPYLNHSSVRLPENMLRFSNTNSNDHYLQQCRRFGVMPHPARMAKELAAFFIDFLTEPGDLVLDPFAGSNSTGFVAEQLKRRWLSIDANPSYGMQSLLRFDEAAHDKGAKYGS